MKVSELGEFGLINRLVELVNREQVGGVVAWEQLLIGIGDDATAWRGDSAVQLATTDSFIQGVHFLPGMATWEDLGWKALAVNLSDIAAMGGLPRYALVSLAMPDDTLVEDIISFYRGIMEVARPWGVAIVGGDVDVAPLFAASITVLGMANQGDVLTRAAACPGEQIAVTGALGGAAAGLEMLKEGIQLNPEGAAFLKAAFCCPSPRLAEGQLLVERGVKTAIDISDGLFSDLTRICQASRVGARLDVDQVPVPEVVRDSFSERYLEMALSGGEDYELLFTAVGEVMDRVQAAAAVPVTVIGEITAGNVGEVTLVDSRGEPFSLRKGGWDHFTGR